MRKFSDRMNEDEALDLMSMEINEVLRCRLRLEHALKPLKEFPATYSECPDCREYTYNIKDGICEECNFTD